jgi:arginine N-succinyltransferase
MFLQMRAQKGVHMFVVRPVELSDIAALESLAAVSMPGVHTLPRTREKIVEAIERSIASFAAQVDIPSEESYQFVLEASGTREIVGTAAIHASAGSNGTYFSFRNDVAQQVSRDLNISHSVHALTLCSELTAYSQLSGFYLRNRGTAGLEAALLSRARLLFAVLAPHRFGDRFFVPLAGITDANGNSPFWDALGRKFFKMDFLDAERVIGGARNRTLIVELMPHYPVYVPLLPGDAQAAMGQIHPDGELAFNLLTEEGFEADEYIDIFDGGPILQAQKNALRSFNSSMLRRVASAVTPADAAGDSAIDTDTLVTYAVAVCREQNFRAITVQCPPTEASDAVMLPPAVHDALRVAAGDNVICVRI